MNTKCDNFFLPSQHDNNKKFALVAKIRLSSLSSRRSNERTCTLLMSFDLMLKWFFRLGEETFPISEMFNGLSC